MEDPTTPTQLPTPKKELPTYLKGFIVTIKLIGYFLFTFILGALAGEGIVALVPQLEQEEVISGSIDRWESMSFFYLGLTIATVFSTWFFRKYVDRRAVETIGWQWKKVGYNLAKGGLWAIGIQTIAFLLLIIFGFLEVSLQTFDGVELVGFLLLFLLVSIQEELIFRGYITSLLSFSLHFLPAIIISALLFAAVHIGNVDFTWMGFGSIFFGGYLLGLLYLKYQNLYLPIGMHWFWNFYHGNILGFDVSGFDVPCLLQLKMNGADWVTGGEFGLEGSVITVILLTIVSVYLTVQWQDDLK